MKDKAPDPETVSGRNGKEVNVVIEEWIEPINATNESIKDEVEKDIRENNGSEDGRSSAFEKEGADRDKTPEGEPEKGEMSPVMMMHCLAMVDEVEVEEIDVGKNASN